MGRKGGHRGGERNEYRPPKGGYAKQSGPQGNHSGSSKPYVSSEEREQREQKYHNDLRALFENSQRTFDDLDKREAVRLAKEHPDFTVSQIGRTLLDLTGSWNLELIEQALSENGLPIRD